MAAYEILLLNTAIPQIQAAQSGDTYVVPRDIAFSTVASFAAGAEATPSIVATGDTNTGIWFPAADTVAISTGGISRLRLDSSGNLGLGVTPSAWGSAYKALQVGYAALSNPTATYDTLNLTANLWHDGTNWRFIETQQANRFSTIDGIWTWEYATGSAGAIAGLSTQMTLDASGNLLVGGTSNAVGARAILENASGNQIGLRYTSVATYYNSVDSSGNLLWTKDGTERARITSGGELLVGNNPTNIRSSKFVVGNAIGGGTGAEINNTDSSSWISLAFHTAGTLVGYISNTTTTTAYNTSSDYRLKNNQQPLTGSGAFIDALKPKTWDWKSGGKGVGFIAHEVQAVSPGTVVGEKDAVDADGKPIMQAMEYGSAEFIANIVAELQSLRARVAQLEQGA